MNQEILNKIPNVSVTKSETKKKFEDLPENREKIINFLGYKIILEIEKSKNFGSEYAQFLFQSFPVKEIEPNDKNYAEVASITRLVIEAIKTCFEFKGCNVECGPSSSVMIIDWTENTKISFWQSFISFLCKYSGY